MRLNNKSAIVYKKTARLDSSASCYRGEFSEVKNTRGLVVGSMCSEEL